MSKNIEKIEEDDYGSLLRVTINHPLYIYRILTMNGKFYIGSTFDIKSRINQHKIEKFKNVTFSFKIIASTEIDEYLEEKFIKRYISKFGKDNMLNKVMSARRTMRKPTVISYWKEKTTTQKAIFAYKNMMKVLESGEKMSIGEAAEKYSSTRNNVSRVKTLASLAPKDIIDALFSGRKINLGSQSSPRPTDSLYSIINYYKKKIDEDLERELESKDSGKLTDDEMSVVRQKYQSILSELNGEQVASLAGMMISGIENNP